MAKKSAQAEAAPEATVNLDEIEDTGVEEQPYDIAADIDSLRGLDDFIPDDIREKRSQESSEETSEESSEENEQDTGEEIEEAPEDDQNVAEDEKAEDSEEIAAGEGEPEAETTEDSSEVGLEEQNRILLAMLQQFSQKQNAPQPETLQEAKAEEKTPPTQQPQQAAAPDVEIPELTEEQFMSMLEDPKSFVGGMQSIISKAVSGVRQEYEQRINNVKQELYSQNLAAQFYGQNPDLEPYREYCEFVDAKLFNEHPDWSDAKRLGEVKDIVGKVIKKAIAAAEKPAEQTPQKKKQPRPAFAGGTGARKGGPQGKPRLSPEEQDIQNLLNTRLF